MKRLRIQLFIFLIVFLIICSVYTILRNVDNYMGFILLFEFVAKHQPRESETRNYLNLLKMTSCQSTDQLIAALMKDKCHSTIQRNCMHLVA